MLELSGSQIHSSMTIKQRAGEESKAKRKIGLEGEIAIFDFSKLMSFARYTRSYTVDSHKLIAKEGAANYFSDGNDLKSVFAIDFEEDAHLYSPKRE